MAIKDIFLPLVGEPDAATVAAIDKCDDSRCDPADLRYGNGSLNTILWSGRDK